jgi:hypothetical protein
VKNPRQNIVLYDRLKKLEAYDMIIRSMDDCRYSATIEEGMLQIDRYSGDGEGDDTIYRGSFSSIKPKMLATLLVDAPDLVEAIGKYFANEPASSVSYRVKVYTTGGSYHYGIVEADSENDVIGKLLHSGTIYMLESAFGTRTAVVVSQIAAIEFEGQRS